MLLLPVAFCTPIHKHGCDLNIEGGEGANVILCYNICDRDCRYFIWTCNMKEIIPTINNFPIFLQHFYDLEYDEKKDPKPLKN